ncbi:MAG: winged helix-turn-helix domain-containing protein [Betaproteobacteria bacterium]|nr:winged helix-turn-helix domain-containing protein [Betaproteobacteria bacterium]
MRLIFGEYVLDTELFELRHNGERSPLEPQVFNLLLYLARNRDRIVSRQELLDKLWAGKIVTESTLSSRIKAARQAVGDSGHNQNCIATFNRRGYRFVAEIVEEREQTGKESIDVFPKMPAPHRDQPSLAVLPFAHNPGDEKIAWIAEMLGEDISIQLARIPGFLVISRNSTAYYRGREFTIDQIGRELETDYVIEGSVWNTGDKLRVSVQLLETSSGRFLWANRTELPANKLGDYQDDVVREIVGQIEPELNRAELLSLRQHRPVDLGAWSLYRQGHALLGIKGWSEETFAEAADLLRQAIARDSELAFAHAYLALLLAIGHLIGLVTDDASREEAVVAAETALALDGQDPDILGYVGCAFADMGEFQRGIGMMRRAVELDPSNAQAHAALGSALLHIGELEGIEEMRYGIRISPRDNRLAAWGAMLARGLLSLGKVDESIEAAEHACRCDDKIFLPRVVLAVAQNTAGNLQAARAALDDARRIRPQLSLNDIARFASPEEISSLSQAGLV